GRGLGADIAPWGCCLCPCGIWPLGGLLCGPLPLCLGGLAGCPPSLAGPLFIVRPSALSLPSVFTCWHDLGLGVAPGHGTVLPTPPPTSPWLPPVHIQLRPALRCQAGRAHAPRHAVVPTPRAPFLTPPSPIADITFKLDERTAHSTLDLFKRDTGAVYRGVGIDPTKAPRPRNPERFRDWAVVLGDTAVDAGRHYWEVTVKRSQQFRLGVADVDVSRDGCIGTDERSWVFAFAQRRWQAFVGGEAMPLPSVGQPERVGLLLDYDAGHLSLVDAGWRRRLHTLSADFRSPVVPAFALWDGELLTHSGLNVPEDLTGD
ncbi:SPRY domain-containing protein 4, partial [Alligator sinensis]|uniref:SPRY domain-containing protein 4 n=1 Tax=Alligator sinensis TaxID=38654 RepID=A0A3Q0FLV8_ALLSI